MLAIITNVVHNPYRYACDTVRVVLQHPLAVAQVKITSTYFNFPCINPSMYNVYTLAERFLFSLSLHLRPICTVHWPYYNLIVVI